MYKTITDLIPPDSDLPARTHELDLLGRVLNGKLYDVLGKEFHEERGANSEYIPLRQRKPSVRYNLCRTVVEDSISLLFSEGQFPTIESADHEARNGARAIVAGSGLRQVMADAAIRGSVGSVAVQMRVLKGRVFFKAFDTGYLTPSWKPDEPDRLARITERYKVRREALEAAGYTVSKDHSWYWFQRMWDEAREVWYLPWPVLQAAAHEKRPAGPVEDPRLTVTHGLGFVPWVWIKNLPGGSSTGDENDGACTFDGAIETQIEIEYQLSQVGRGLKYSSDPTLLIKEPAFGEQSEFVRSAANALVVSQNGDAELLELKGTASGAVLEYVRVLREAALEAMHGNRTMADKLSASQSGRAMELMHQALVWLAGHLRHSYGDNGLLTLLEMVAVTSRKMELTVKGRKILPIPEDAELSLRWPPWFEPTGTDMVEQANATATWRAAGAMSQQTAVRITAQTVGVDDVEAEIAEIQRDQTAILAGTALAPTGTAIAQSSVPKPNGTKGNGGEGNG
jgi:hypothetical protein